MRDSLHFLIYLVLFSTCFYASAQTDPLEPLPIILGELQERFDIQFNYASKLVDDITITSPQASLTLEQSLLHLSEHSNLSFVFVSDSIISIKLKKILLCGYLKDKDTGEALPYVAVQVGSMGVIANEEGYFELDGLKRDDFVFIKHIGFKPIRREVQLFDTSQCGEVVLVPHQEKLAEVTVYDFLVRGIDKLDNGSFRLDFDRFSILPGLVEDDVLQSVQALPGIQSIDETVSNINIRGGSNDQNFISWDGIKMYQSGHFFGLISMYNPLITQKVELRKNGSSVSETDGVSGSIAMKTNEYLNSDLKGSIGVNLIDANGSVDIPIGQKASLQIAARKSISDFVETPTYSRYFDRIIQDTEIARNTETVTNSDIAFDFYDASFRLLLHPSEKDRLRVNFMYTANEVAFNENTELVGVAEIRESNLDQSTIAGGIYHERNWTETFSTETSVYNTDYKLKGVNVNILEDQRFLQENKVSETGLKFITRNNVASRINWTNGYHFVETKVTNLDDVDDPSFIRLNGEVLRTHSIFTEIGLSSNNKSTRLNLGVRFNHLDEFKKQLWEPRLSFNHSFWQDFNLEVLGEFKHQSTSQIINFQNDFLGLEKRRWQLSNNESIPIITSKQASLGLGFNKKGWLVNAVSFYKSVNGVTTQSQGFQNQYEFVKTSGSYDATGLDLMLRKQFQDNSIWLSYSYLNSSYFFEELPETSFPNNFEITHTLTTGVSYTIRHLLLGVGLNWRKGKPISRPMPDNELIDGEISYEATNEDRLANYLRMDFSSNYQFKWGKTTKAQIGLSVWNVLNRNNTINAFYRINALQEVQKFEQSSLGITPNLSFRLFFD